MAETRMQLWRQRMRAEGKEQVTLWITTADKARLEALARTRHCAPSAVLHQALSQLTDDATPHDVSVTDTANLRRLIREELRDMLTESGSPTEQREPLAVKERLIHALAAEDAELTRAEDAAIQETIEALLEETRAPVTDTVSVTVSDTTQQKMYYGNTETEPDEGDAEDEDTDQVSSLVDLLDKRRVAENPRPVAKPKAPRAKKSLTGL